MKPKDHTEQLVFCSFEFLNRKCDGLIRQFIFLLLLAEHCIFNQYLGIL